MVKIWLLLYMNSSAIHCVANTSTFAEYGTYQLLVQPEGAASLLDLSVLALTRTGGGRHRRELGHRRISPIDANGAAEGALMPDSFFLQLTVMLTINTRGVRCEGFYTQARHTHARWHAAHLLSA